MIQIISKSIVADKGIPLIYEEPFERIREQMDGVHPYYKNKHDTGSPKKTFLDNWLGLGSNDRAPNAGAGMGLGRDPNESADKSLSSGYNDGEQADDETGPGYARQNPNPYFTQDVDNELFMDLRIKGKRELDSVQSHIRSLLDSPSVIPVQHRYPVDSRRK